MPASTGPPAAVSAEDHPSAMAYHTSLLTATDSRAHIHVVVGANPLAAVRCSQSLAVGAQPVLVTLAPPSTDKDGRLPAALQVHVDAGQVRWVREAFQLSHLFALGRPEVDGVVDAVFITELDDEAAAAVSAACRRHRIPINVLDRPGLCTFTLLSTFADGPLQVGITTNGSGCMLAARIRRELAAALPKGLGAACSRLGSLRRQIREEDRRHQAQQSTAQDAPACPGTSCAAKRKRSWSEVSVDDTVFVAADDDGAQDQPATFNRLVTNADPDAARTRRMRWLAQMCEYWPLKRLAAVTDAEVEALLRSYGDASAGEGREDDAARRPTADNDGREADAARPAATTDGSAGAPAGRRGRIILAGSGPGHPDLLTRAVHQAILSADLILADKLVPQGVLDLIPRHTEVAIARKFPGNAEAAQDELVAQAVAAARAGKTVLRLKQGDPFVYGRGGEEVLRLRAAGFADPQAVLVLPGVTSALSGPLFAAIPPTHRDVADQVLICTGTGRKGVAPQPPGYRASRTAVFLMALHRIAGLVAELTEHTADETSETNERPPRVLWPRSTPCAVIERASCPDQKVVRTTLAHVVAAVEQEGSRPPGLLVVGGACGVLHAGPGDADKETPWVVEDGFAGFDLSSVASLQ